MCQDCGCMETGKIKIGQNSFDAHQGAHSHHGHEHGHKHGHGKIKTLELKQRILAKNDQAAAHNRAHLKAKQVFSINLISAPGSGKTSLLEKIIVDGALKEPIFVIEGDLQTDRDAERIRKAGAKSLQINTGAACHLDAPMIHQALHQIELQQKSWLFIENVGNMVCPTAYDLGEDFKVAMIGCTEGEDKPAKYPDLLLAAQALLINKVDLAEVLEFDLDAFCQLAKKVNPSLALFPVSAKTGQGIGEFCQWLGRQREKALAQS